MKATPVRVQRVIAASPEAIFDLLADPSRHADLDGSGTVRTSRGGSRRLQQGDRFGMDMDWKVKYATSNEVTRCESGRVIEWRTLAPEPLRKVFTGRTWRYELEPVDGGTRVTETWDPTTEAPLGRLLLPRMAELTRRNMEKTLERLDHLVTGA